jgi:DNA repair exonuclease SbcCD ATPase subunit
MAIDVRLQDPEELLVLLGQKYETLLRAEETLNERRMEIGQLVAELQALRGSALPGQSGEVESLRREVEELHQLLVERERELAEAGTAHDADKEQKFTTLEEENRRLCRQIEEKNRQVEMLRNELEELLQASPEAREAKDYEEEINEFRRQLQSDRQSLNEEIRQLQIRNTELNEAARQSELELSRERAHLARERAQLDRLRDEIRQELERAQREAGVRERLAPVQRLKDEMSDRRQDGNGSSSATKDAGSRWSNFMKRVGE